MESVSEVVKTIANSAIQAGLIASIVGIVCVSYMLMRTTKRTKQSKATKVDALFLSYSSPGFSRFAIFNSPDTIGIGVYAALALEQVGAIKDIKPHIEVNLRMYPDWPAAYLSAARYSAIVGDRQKARDYMSVANTLAESNKHAPVIPQLKPSAIESLIVSEVEPLSSTDSLEAIFDELRKKPLQLILTRSVLLILLGIGFVLCGILLLMMISVI